jgi:plasmid replication protein rep
MVVNMGNKSTKKIFSITQKLDENYWFDWTDEEISSFGELEKHAAIIKRKLEDNGIAVEEMHAIYHDKDSTTIWNDYTKLKETVYKDIHIHVLFKTVDGQDVEAIASAVGVQPQYIEYAKRGKYAYNNMLSYLIHAKDAQKHQYSPKEVITLIGEDYSKIYQENKLNWQKGALVKTDDQKVHKLTTRQIDVLLEKIMDNEVSRAYVENMPEPRMAYISNRRLFENAFEIANKNKLQRYRQDLAAMKFKKINVYLYGDTGVGKSALTREISKAVTEKVYNDTGKVWNTVSLAARNAMDEYTDEEIIILDDFRSNSMDFNEILTLLDPHHTSPAPARYHNKHIQYRLAIITAPYKLKVMYYVDSEDFEQLDRRIEFNFEVTKDNQEEQENLKNEILKLF